MATYEDVLGSAAAAGALARRPAPYALLGVRGPDAVDFVQRLCAQDVAGMAAGAAAPAAFLDGKGKLVATARVGIGAEGIWLETSDDIQRPLAEHLELYHFSEKMEIAPERDSVCAELVGGRAAEIAGVPARACVERDGGVLLSGARRGLQWVRWHAPADAAPPWPDDVPELSPQLAECLRICVGLVRVGADTEPGTLALEADLDDHVSLTKGCYTGQEIVARIHTYGHVNRKIRLLRIEDPGEVEVGTTLFEPGEGDAVGRVMTSAAVPGARYRVGLGYLPKAFWDAGAELRLGAAGGARVEVLAFGEE